MSDSVPCMFCKRTTEDFLTRVCPECWEFKEKHPDMDPNGYCHGCGVSIQTTLAGRAYCQPCGRDM